MPNYSLILTPSLQDADDSAILDWHWERSDEMHNEYRRPDTGERARFALSLRGLRWNTKVYVGRNWQKRSDYLTILELIDIGFFKPSDPDLPPPRSRRLKQPERTNYG